MEKNTYATSAYIDAPHDEVLAYLEDLQNLGEWTLYSRMLEQVDDDTWLGTASGYQSKLYYHLERVRFGAFSGIEWHCGLNYGEYYQVYPVLLFPPEYLAAANPECGTYFHWISFVDPERAVPMIPEAIDTVHNSECRSLKARLERRQGHRQPARGRHELRADTIYIDAPVETGVDYLANVANVADWAHLLQVRDGEDPQSGRYVDEYGRRVEIAFRVHPAGRATLIEQDYYYPDDDVTERCPVLLIPAAYAFGNENARGFIQHRITFWRCDAVPTIGRLSIDDYGAESMNLKRLLEAKAGNLETFAQGRSYQPSTLRAVS